MVYIFFHLTEAFHYRQATASSIAKILLEKIIFTWGILLKLHSDKGTRFMGQVFCQLYCLASSTTLSLCCRTGPLDPQCLLNALMAPLKFNLQNLYKIP